MDMVFILFLLPFFFLLHKLEEILMVHRWIEKNGAAMHRRFPRLRYLIRKMEEMTTRKMEEMTTRRFATIAFEEFLIVSACTFDTGNTLSGQTGGRTGPRKAYEKNS